MLSKVTEYVQLLSISGYFTGCGAAYFMETGSWIGIAFAVIGLIGTLYASIKAIDNLEVVKHG